MSWRAQQVMGILLALQTLFVGSTFDNMILVCLGMAAASVFVLMRHRRESNLVESQTRLDLTSRANSFRPIWISLLFAVVLVATCSWRLIAQLGPNNNVILIALDTLSHMALAASLLLWAVRPQRAHFLMLLFGMIVVLFGVAAGGATRSLAAQTSLTFAVCLGFSIASQIILGTARGTRGEVFGRDQLSTTKMRWIAPVFSLLTLSVLLMASSVIASATNVVLPTIQNRLQHRLHSTLDSMVSDSMIGGTRYVRGGRIGSIRRHILGDPEDVALTVLAESAPGYMRGHAFEQFREMQWKSLGDTGAESLFEDYELAPEGIGRVQVSRKLWGRPLKRFRLVDLPSHRRSDEATIDLEIKSYSMKGSVTFLPLATRWIEAQSGELRVTQHNTIRYGVDVDKPYVAGVALFPSPQQLDPRRRRVLLDAPPKLDPVLFKLASEICDAQPSARTKAEAVSNFFQSEFDYSLSSVDNMPDGADRMWFFLTERHPAHCEYFATASALILRKAGIPTRYVTGYIVDEPDAEESDKWLGRNRDAHAWVEAYDDATSQWFAVESTPGRTYRTVTAKSDSTRDGGMFGGVASGDDEENASLLSQFWDWIRSQRIVVPLLAVSRVAQLPLFLFLLGVLWFKYLKPNRDEVDPIDQQSLRMLKHVDRKIRKHNLVRDPSETLCQFADRIDDSRRNGLAKKMTNVDGFLESTAVWYRGYASARYRGQLPKPLSTSGS